MDDYEKYRALFERRLPFVVRAVSEHSGLSISDDFSPSRSSIANYLTLATFRMGFGLAYWGSFEACRDNAPISEWMKILRANGRNLQLAELLNCNEEVCSARVRKVGSHVLSVSHDYEYLYGPKSAVVACHGQHTRIFPTLRWHYRWLIPQVEVMLAEQASDTQVVYDDSMIPTGIVKDADSREIN